MVGSTEDRQEEEKPWEESAAACREIVKLGFWCARKKNQKKPTNFQNIISHFPLCFFFFYIGGCHEGKQNNNVPT